eukprot:superscaffoldBa00006981_g22106
MSGESEANKEFMEQLRMQELYGQRNVDGSDPFTYTDPEDGTVYDWDHEKKAWFPKITEDFIAAYQANYGFTKDGDPDANNAAVSSTDPAAPEKEKPGDDAQKPKPEQQETPAKEAKQKGEKRKAEPGWFDIDDNKNTNVYVSGLPPDTSTEEFVEMMSKCGIVMRDPITEEYKVKLYKDKEGNLKGDGLCCYLKKESVALATRLIDETEVRGYRLHVEAARFELKGQYDASKKKKKNKEYRKKLQQQQKYALLPVEETTREREERLKTWSTFLDGSAQGQQNNNNNSAAKPAAEGANTTEPTEPSSTTEPKQHPETEPQPSQQQEQEVDSTDSSLAGSDDEEA